MKLASTLFGVILAQEGSGQVDYDYGEDAERGKLKKQEQQGYSAPTYNYQSYETPTYQYSDNSYYGKSNLVVVKAVTCWESNHMGSHDTNPDGHSHEGVAPLTSGATQDSRDNYGWLNIHENHKVNVDDDPVHNAHSLDAFDHRLSGCIYEGSGFTYLADTYNVKWEVEYKDTTTLTPVWWHYFNAHVFSGGNKKMHYIAMANPTYEGLGYVNFIVTYVAQAIGTTGAISGYINTNENLHTDLYTDASNIEIKITGDNWYSILDTNLGWTTENVAISSFPQNDLGKDFRFNIRILHRMGEADHNEDIDSYYWYKVNKVTITFPSTVGCHWDSMATTSDGYFRCMDSASGPAAGNSGHMSWVSDDGAHSDSTERTFDESFPAATAYIGGSCSDTYDEQKMACGTAYSVEGLMNTYDEYAQQEYGTHQEFWFQFNYYYVFDPILNNLCEDHEDFDCYQAPNHLFNAFEVTTVEIECNTNNLLAHNGNKCANTGTAKSVETWS
jgi:hypothetical protein